MLGTFTGFNTNLICPATNREIISKFRLLMHLLEISCPTIKLETCLEVVLREMLNFYSVPFNTLC